MRRIVFLTVILFSICAGAQVQTVGDVSFAVPDGWEYQKGPDFGGIVSKTTDRFWLIAVYSPMPTSGDPNADFKAAWKRVLMATPGFQLPGYSPYTLDRTVGYGGIYYDADADNHTSYARLYVLETGKNCIPVAYISLNRAVLDQMEHMARAVVGSVRLAPAKASPIKSSITLADLAGEWNTGVSIATAHFNTTGQYQNTTVTAGRTNYIITANGNFTYKLGGIIENNAANDNDSGVIELSGEFVTFKGRKHNTQYRFLNIQQGIDGSTVLTLLPPQDMSKLNVMRDSTFLVRAPQTKAQ